jgi:NADPH:quinone reductase-like Zn-dependent oxidoreductase
MLITRLLNLSLGKIIGQGCSIKEIPTPSIEDHEILVKVTAVALNPTDFKHIDFLSPPNSIIGCDYAGEVVLVGKAALGGWQLGDRVAGLVHGGVYPDRGAFAEYLKTDADLTWKVPASVTDEAAATYGVSAVTAMMVIHLRLGVEDNSENAAPILIYAGSTCAGLFAIQLAKKAGRMVVTTASPHSLDLVKGYGADHVFDYRSKSAAAEIIKAFPDITLAMDCFSEAALPNSVPKY